ncbi:MAG: PAS domain-containing protein [Verrucomicrobia bacterium]|nr:PAS domain-containing protein [Verrucomicrobiota bacterium]
MKLLDYLSRQPRHILWLYALMGIVIVGSIDYFSGREIGVSIFYLFPIGAIAWFLGRRSGVLAAGVGAVAWLAAELLSISEYSHPVVPFWNGAVRAGFFLVSAALISEVAFRKKIEETLRSQTSVLQSILNSMGDGVMVTDSQGRIILYNPAAERLLRSSLANTTLRDWLAKEEIFLPDRLTPYPAREHPLQKAILGEATTGVEMFVRDSNSAEEIWLVATGRPLIVNTKGNGGVLVLSDASARKLLEKQIAEISDREQLRMGHDLHDGVCQQLVSTAFAASVLHQRLIEKSLPESKTAEQIVDLLNDAISDSRSLARGLYPVKLDLDGLSSALEELAESTENISGISCHFECEQAVLIHDAVAGTNLYRIAQEAVNNAVKHSKAKSIIIELEAVEEEVMLTVNDDGIGFLPGKVTTQGGMGLHIMRYRARLIGASLEIRRGNSGGTGVICSFLNTNQVMNSHERSKTA